MEQIYNKIWELAKPYYKKGRPMDIDHIKWMMQEAVVVCQKEKLDDSILLPLVILHDAGYGVGKHVYFEKELKKEHMENGKQIAKEILSKLNYPKDKIDKIEYYISVHDNWALGDNEIYKKEGLLGIFTDLDYMWLATSKGFSALMKILGKGQQEMIEYLETNDKLILRPFSTKTTKNLYERYLEDRRKEALNIQN